LWREWAQAWRLRRPDSFALLPVPQRLLASAVGLAPELELELCVRLPWGRVARRSLVRSRSKREPDLNFLRSLRLSRVQAAVRL